MQNKRCNKCGLTKRMESFNRDSATKDGRRNWCRACTQLKDAKYLAKPGIAGQRIANARAHAIRQVEKLGREANYFHIHDYMNTTHPRTGACELCGSSDKRTHWANLSNEYDPFDLNDWIELCPLHHKRMDLYKLKIAKSAEPLGIEVTPDVMRMAAEVYLERAAQVLFTPLELLGGMES